MRRRMVALQRALEGRTPGHRSSNLRLASIVVLHQIVGLIGLSLAAPDPPGDDTQAGQDDSTADTDDDANNGIAGLDRHAAAGLVAVLVAVVLGSKAGRWGRGGEGFGRHGRRDTLLVDGGNDLGDGLDDGLDRRAGLGFFIVIVVG